MSDAGAVRRMFPVRYTPKKAADPTEEVGE